jgi:Zn-dependent M16 (insulinase) family peptidase
MEPGTTCHGFSVESCDPIAELDANATMLRHEETGAKVLLIDAEDDNKVFKISFPTHPKDDTGVAHILEHAVLNGSKKYPLKEPFAELARGSLCTFLNAFTYPDRTCYPVASCNHDDFENLVDVYLDAVFNPLISETTFAQEGWHYELNDEKGPLAISGVVYNEMHGAYANPEAQLDTDVDRALTPNSLYGLDSGGDPAAIPDLTYDQFKTFFDDHYHPANSYTVVYGDFEADRVLDQINGFFSGRGKGKACAAPKVQRRFKAPKKLTGTYSAPPETEAEGNTYLYRAWLLEPGCTPADSLALTVLFRTLTGRPSSPLRKALIESHLGADAIGGSFSDELFEKSFGIGLKDSSPDKAAEFTQLIDQTLVELVRDGLDPDAIEAAINATEFALREANFGGYPKGLIYALSVLPAWVYGDDPLEPLRYEQHLLDLRERVANSRYFEELIQTWLIDNTHQLHVVYTPEPGKAENTATALAEQLAERLKSMSKKERKDCVATCKALEAAQDEPDSPEAKASLPQLPLSALAGQARRYPFEVVTEGPPTYTFSEQPTAGISYVRVAFDTNNLPMRLMPLVPFFGKACLLAGTRKRDYVSLAQDIDIHTGGIGASTRVRSILREPDRARSALAFSAKGLTVKSNEIIELLREIWLNAKFDNAVRLLEIARSSLTRLERTMPSSGHSVVAKRLSAQFSRSGAYSELYGGVTQHRYLKKLIARLEVAPETVMADLEEIRRTLITQSGFHLHATGSEQEHRTWQRAVKSLSENLPDGMPMGELPELPLPQRGEAFTIPANTHFVGLGANLLKLGWEQHGSFAVLETLLSRDYLWNQVRARGGAYGCFLQANSYSGSCAMISYRDPRVGETFDAYRGVPEFLRNLELSQREFEKLIIGTIGSADSPRTPEQAGDLAWDRHYAGLSPQEVQIRRDELLSCTIDQIKDYADIMQQFVDSAVPCVVGTSAQIEAHKDAFDVIKPLLGDPPGQ